MGETEVGALQVGFGELRPRQTGLRQIRVPEELLSDECEVALAGVLEADDRWPIRRPGLYQFRLLQEPQYSILASGIQCV